MWEADITYIATKEGWFYVAGVLDACSRRIVGWAADDTMPTALVARAFERAIPTQRPPFGLLHHSDRGSRYASDAYRELLRRHGVVLSMSRPGNCYVVTAFDDGRARAGSTTWSRGFHAHPSSRKTASSLVLS